mmetsp:Transcript_1818/g.6169  ORF Transcript_1818/g.6169 Transcript_1818/m.6169 type:complete len:224 (+) Transcript_1818:1991-2662(+)
MDSTVTKRSSARSIWPSSMNSATSFFVSLIASPRALMSSFRVSVIFFCSSLPRSSYVFIAAGMLEGILEAFQNVPTTSSSRDTRFRSSNADISPDFASVFSIEPTSTTAPAANRRKSSSCSGVSTSRRSRSLISVNRAYASLFSLWKSVTNLSIKPWRRFLATSTNVSTIRTQSTPIIRNGSKEPHAAKISSIKVDKRRSSSSSSGRVRSGRGGSSVAADSRA